MLLLNATASMVTTGMPTRRHVGWQLQEPRMNWELVSVQGSRKLICAYPEKGLGWRVELKLKEWSVTLSSTFFQEFQWDRAPVLLETAPRMP
jgi:hypothetical protein